MNEAHHRRLEASYHGAPCNEYFRPRLTVGDGEATVELDVRPDFYHAMDAVHGSTLFKLLDDAAFFAANSVVADVWVLTTTYTVHFLRPVSAGTLVARGRVLKRGSRAVVAESHVVDEQGDEAARGMGSFAVSDIAIKPS